MFKLLEDNRFAVLFFILWGLLASLQFYVLGDNSYIRVHDNGDSNHPKAYANLNFPNQSESRVWKHWSMCGIDGNPQTYRHGLYSIIQILLPGWGGHALLMILQRICAGVFMFLLVRRTLGLGINAAFAAGMLYPFLIAMAPLGIYHALGEPCLPGYIFVFNELIRCRRLWVQLVGGFILGAIFATFSSVFVSQPFLLVVILIFILLVQRLNVIKILPAALACLAAIVIMNLPPILNTWEIKDGTQRMLLVSEKTERTFWNTLKSCILGFVGVMRNDGVPVLVCFTAVLWGALRKWLFRTTFWMFIIFGVFSTFVPYIFTSIFNIDFFKAYNIRRFYFEYPFFLYIAAGIGVEFITAKLSSQEVVNKKILIRSLLIIGLLLASAVLISIRFYSAFRSVQVNTGDLLSALNTKRAAQVLTILVFLFMSGFIGISSLIKRKQISTWLMIMAVSLLPFYAGFCLVERLSTNLASGENYRKLYHRPEYELVANEIETDEPYRVATAFPDRRLHPVFVNIPGLETVDGYNTLYPVRYHLFWKKVIEAARLKNSSIERYFDSWGQRVYLFSPFGKTDYPPDDFPVVEAFNLNLLSLANAKYIFSRIRLKDDRLLMMDEREYEDDILVYRNMDVLPRFFLVNRSIVFEDSVALLDSLANSGTELLRKTAFLEAQHLPPLPDSTQILANSDLKIITYSSDFIELSVASGSDALLIITNNWSPYWEAVTDGIKQEVYPVDFTFMCVYLPPKSKKVELQYTRKRLGNRNAPAALSNQGTHGPVFGGL